MSCCSKLNCSEVCECIFLRSPDNTIIINKNGCIWDVQFDMSLIPEQQIINDLIFDPDTRELCSTVNGIESCVTIPNDDEYLELDGTVLSIYSSNDTLLSSVDLSSILEQIPFAATSDSLVITAGGILGHSPNIEIVPSSDPNNSFILGSDGRPYVAESTQNPVVGVDTNTVDITITGVNNNEVNADVKYEDSESINLSDSSNGLKAELILDPASTADVSISPNGLLVNVDNVNVEIDSIPGLAFTKTVVGNTITFTPILDFIYIASEVCPLCPPPEIPCGAPTVTITDITDGTLTVSVTPLAAGDEYSISLDGGITWISTGNTTVTTEITDLLEITNYNIVVRLFCNTGGTVETVPQSINTLDCAEVSDLSVVMSAGASAVMNWTPVTFMSSQIPQYKLSVASTYTSLPSTTSGTANIPTMLNDRFYDFRILTSCHNPNTSTSQVVQKIGLRCPVTFTASSPSTTSISYSHTGYESTDVTSIKVDLLPATGTTVLQTHNNPKTISTGTFTGLNPLTTYRVRVTLFAQGVSELFTVVCPTMAQATTSGTIYARLDYEVPGSGSCTDANTSDNGFRYVNAVWKTFSDSAGTIPITPPAGTIINYDRNRVRRVCTCSSPTQTYTLNDNVNYNLTLTSTATTVPNSQKYTSGLDWFYCSSNPGTPCEGGDPGSLICVQNNFISNYHQIDYDSATSVGTIAVVFI